MRTTDSSSSYRAYAPNNSKTSRQIAIKATGMGHMASLGMTFFYRTSKSIFQSQTTAGRPVDGALYVTDEGLAASGA
jgi:hypothetical protein